MVPGIAQAGYLAAGVFAAIDPAWAEPLNNLLLIVLLYIGTKNRTAVKEITTMVEEAKEAAEKAESILRSVTEKSGGNATSY